MQLEKSRYLKQMMKVGFFWMKMIQMTWNGLKNKFPFMFNL
ncbi:hypothetical protein BRO54_2015 [Geobacillus proteiniphilus]|uniref:Uncharacterized protein n=1 Tax=Geobacillus proteiniphilus TaxID=860353 RepID=A0A1Q5SYY4_9BACL|nr:hypothetical protein BRO54_2015 [Geobacillus proteiniphilus]